MPIIAMELEHVDENWLYKKRPVSYTHLIEY